MTCVTVACDKPYTPSNEGSKPDVAVPDGGSGDVEQGQTGEVLWAENDTARFYMQRREVKDMTLTDYPTPSSLIKDPRVLKLVDAPVGCLHSKQRILCFNNPNDKGIKAGSATFGTGRFYTFVPHGTVIKSGMKTKYCILPIRTERTSEEDHVDITVNDEWD